MKITLLKRLLLFGTFICFSAVSAQTVSGTVTDSSGPLPGASVVVKGTTIGTQTDFDGNYTLDGVDSSATMLYSYIGYATQEVAVNGRSAINVTLLEDACQLEEVVVIGYGTQKKSHTTGSISKVVNDDLDQIAVARVDDALVGQVSGVNIQATDGEAGSAPINIRGVGSMAGDSSPLVVVDGVIVDSDFLGS